MVLPAISTGLFMALLVIGLVVASAIVYSFVSRALNRRRYSEMAGADEALLAAEPTGLSPEERTLDPPQDTPTER